MRDFDRIDSDRSGHIGEQEVRAAVAVRGLPSTYVQAFMKAADRDGDGRVSLSEFQSFCDQREARLRTIFAKIDSDGDGKLTSDEIRAGAETLGVRISSEQLRVFVERLDTDRDSAITFSEFRSLLLLLPEVNPVAVFEAFQAAAVVDHANSEYTPPPERAAEESLAHALFAKLYSGSIAGAVSRTCTAPIDRLKTMMQVGPTGQGGMAQVARAPALSAARFPRDLPARSRPGLTARVHAARRDGAGRAAHLRRGRPGGLLPRQRRQRAQDRAGDLGQVHRLRRLQGRARARPGLPWVSNASGRAGAVATGRSTALLTHVRAPPRGQANVTGGERFVAGGAAGATGQLAVYPLEIAKTRLAVSPSGAYAGLADVLRKVYRAEGLGALYQGLSVAARGRGALNPSWDAVPSARLAAPIAEAAPTQTPARRLSARRRLRSRPLRSLPRGEPAPSVPPPGTSVVGIVPYAGVDLAVNSLLKVR
jgi:Ca2+-binding EF-hand superfamily protein